MKEQPPKNTLGENLGQDSLAALQGAMKNTSEIERSADTSSENVDLNLDKGAEPEANNKEEERQLAIKEFTENYRGYEKELDEDLRAHGIPVTGTFEQKIEALVDSSGGVLEDVPSEKEIKKEEKGDIRAAEQKVKEAYSKTEKSSFNQKLEDAAYFAMYGRKPTNQENIDFYNQNKGKILALAEQLTREKRRRWEALSEKDKSDFISEKTKQGNTNWLPWEKDFQNRGPKKESPEKREVDIISDKEYEDFVDNNKVSEERLNSIARKVAYRKGGSTESVLSEREKAIFANKTSEIQKIIQGFEKQEAKSDRFFDKFSEKVDFVEAKQEAEVANTLEGISKQADKIAEEERVQKEMEDAFKSSLRRNYQEEVRVKISPKIKEVLAKMNMTPEKVDLLAPELLNLGLSENQQLYVLEKLRQKINLDAELESEQKVEDVIKGKTKFLSKEWLKKQKFKITKEFQEDRFKKESIDRVKQSGLSDYVEDLRTLSRHVSEMGLDINYVDGKPVISYEKADTFKNAPEYAKRFGKNFDPEALTLKFNMAATALSEIPYEWTLPQATFAQKRKYKKALEAYESQRTILGGARLEEIRSNIEPEKVELAWKIWQDSIDSTVKMNQILTSHPEIANFDEDPKLKPSFRKAVNFAANTSNWTKAKAAFIFGAGARWLSRQTLSFAGGVVAAGAVGGFLGWRKKALEYDTKERKQRYGIDAKEAGIKKYVKGEEAAMRISELTEMLRKVKGDEKKAEAVARRLRNHIFLTEERVSEGRVDFGSQKERLSAMTKLERKISEANNELFLVGAYNDDESAAELLKRFNKSIGDRKAANIKNWDKTKAALIGAATAGAGFSVGWGFREAYDLIGSGQSIPSRWLELIREGGDGIRDDVAPGLRDSYSKEEVAKILEDAKPKVVPEEVPGPGPSPEPVTETPEPEVKSETRPQIEKTEPVVDETAKIKENIREIKTADGDLYEMEVRNKLKVPEVMEFKKDSQNFLVPDMTEAQAKQIIRPVEDQIREHIAWKNVLKVYPEGSPQHEWIKSEMERLSGEIRNGLPEGVDFKGLEGVEATPSPEIETPQIKGFPAPNEAPNPSPDFESVKEAYQDAGFEHKESGFGDVFSKEVPMETQNDLVQNYYENGYQGDPEVLEKVRGNVSEITGINGEIQDMNIRDIAKIEDVKSFRGNAGKFLIDDMSKSGLSEEFQTRSWGIKSLNSVRNQAEEFLAWKEYIKAYPEGSPQHEWIKGEMTNLGEEIRGKVGNIFAPYEEMNGVPRPKIDPENLYPQQPENPTATIKSFKAPEVLASVDETAGDAAETPIRGFKAPANIETPEVATPKISVNEDVVTPSVENGSTTLDFNSEEVAGKLSFVEDSEGNLEIKESPDFSTEAGKEFRANPRKFISQEDIDKTVAGLRKDGVNATPKSVIDRYEDFINRREALRVSGLPLDSKEALAFKTEMKGIESIFEKHTGTGLVDRIGAVESGRGIESLVPEGIEPEVSEVASPDNGELALSKSANPIDVESKIFEIVTDKYGEAKVLGNNILEFSDGEHMGFYSESMDQNVAIEKSNMIAIANKESLDLGRPVDRLATRTTDGRYRVVTIYKKIN